MTNTSRFNFPFPKFQAETSAIVSLPGPLKASLQSQNTTNTAWTLTLSTTAHCRHCLQLSGTLTTNLTYIRTKYCYNSQSSPLVKETSSTSTAWLHIYSYPLCVVWTLQPTWLIRAVQTTNIDTWNSIETQCVCEILVTLVPNDQTALNCRNYVKIVLRASFTRPPLNRRELRFTTALFSALVILAIYLYSLSRILTWIGHSLFDKPFSRKATPLLTELGPSNSTEMFFI